MSTNGVSLNGVLFRTVAEVQQAVKEGKLTPEQGKNIGALLGAPQEADEAGTKVEQNPTKLTQEEAQEAQANRAAAQQKANDEVAQMKAAAQQPAKEEKITSDKVDGELAALQAKDPSKAAQDTTILKEGLGKIDTKEKAKAEGFSNKAAKKVARAARKDLSRIDTFDAVEKIFTDKKEYEAAVKAAKADGTWNKDLPKYTLLQGKALEGAKKMAKDSAAQVDKAKADYDKYKKIFDNAASKADQYQAFREMCKAAETMAKNLNASQMFDADGNLNTDAYKNTMLQYSGTDFKGNLDERKALKEAADVKKRKTKPMFEAAGIDVEKDMTWAYRGAALIGGVGMGALTGLLGGGAVATAVAQVVSTATSTATATATASATATANIDKHVYYEGIMGDVFEDYFGDSVTTTVVSSATTTVTNTVTKTGEAVARASISRASQALRGAIGALPAAILSAAMIKDRGGKDAFNGLTPLQVLNDAKQVRGKANQEIVQKIIDLPNITASQKAAILQAAYGDNTAKKVNTQELVAAYTAAQYLNDHPELVNPQEKPEGPTSTPPTTTPTTPVTPPTTQPVENTDPCERKVQDGFNFKFKPGWGPSQYGEALGLRGKALREFINQFRADNNLDRQGIKFTKEPYIRSKYTLDGKEYDFGDQDAIQKKLDNYHPTIKYDNSKVGTKSIQAHKASGHWVTDCDFTYKGHKYKKGDIVPNEVINAIRGNK